ncbi:phosphotransferase family protein [Burkholderia pseudomallei]|uniref:phosphotransferase family protein n=1 Tax=Burkholderia pseudomallei TaxID=28450 RepID=UPI001E422059|nr:aminoglycoside phosphotransferase family protein [Burkholderia pseudomallei]
MHGASVASKSGRNKNIVVQTGNHVGFFLKQYANSDRMLSEVATCALMHDGTFAVPKVLHYSEMDEIAVFDLVRESIRGWSPFTNDGDTPQAARACHLIGSTLAKIHRKALLVNQPGMSFQNLKFKSSKPWGFGIQMPNVRDLSSLSRGNVQLLSIIQSEFFDDIQRTTSRWNADGIIHGDSKIDNIIFYLDEAAREKIIIVDWETAQLGEFAWDLAGFVQDGVVQRIKAAEFKGETSSNFDGLPALLTELLVGYQDFSCDAHSNEFVLRVTELSGVRLLQSAYEFSQHSPKLLRGAVTMLQVAHNILRDPQVAASKLFDKRIN